MIPGVLGRICLLPMVTLSFKGLGNGFQSEGARAFIEMDPMGRIAAQGIVVLVVEWHVL